MPHLPIAFLGDLNLGMSRINCRNRFKSIVSTPKGVLWNMSSCHCLTCGTRSKTSHIISLRLACRRMRCKRSTAYGSHFKHARTDPCSTCLDSFARPDVPRICLLEKREHAFGAICSPGRHQSLVLFAVFFHKLNLLQNSSTTCGEKTLIREFTLILANRIEKFV